MTRQIRKPPTRSQKTADALFSIACVYAFICAFILVVSLFMTMGQSYQYASAQEVAAKAFNLESDTEYPLRYGTRVEGSSGYAEIQDGLFSASAKVNLQAASSLSVNYQYEKNSYILELPMNRIRFVQQSEGESSIRLRISNAEFGSSLDEGQRTIRFLGVPFFYHPPKTLEETGWFKSYKEDGQLGPLVSDHFESAVITLNPEDYSKILGG